MNYLDQDLRKCILGNLSRQDDLNGKIGLCLMDGQRDLNFLLRRDRLLGENINITNEILEDIKTLRLITPFSLKDWTSS